MKNNQIQPKKYPSKSKKGEGKTIHINLMKRNVTIKENNSTIFNFF